MTLSDYLKYFLNSETPFMLLFVSLFFYTVKNYRERELYLSQLFEKKLSKIEEEINVLIRVWKILLEKELEKK